MLFLVVMMELLYILIVYSYPNCVPRYALLHVIMLCLIIQNYGIIVYYYPSVCPDIVYTFIFLFVIMVLRYSCILHYVPRYYLQDDIDTRAIQYCTIREHILIRDCKMTSHQLFVAGLVDTRAIQYCTIREHILIREHSLI